MCDVEKKLIDKALDYADKIVVPPLEEIGGIFADQFRFWRYKNQINIIRKVEELHRKKMIDIRVIPVKTLASLLDYSSMEEEESIREKWANLLFNATNSKNQYDSHFTLVSILKELSVDEVKVLDYIWMDAQFFDGNIIFRKIESSILLYMNLRYPDKYDYDEVIDYKKQSVLIDNLKRLNLIEREDMKIDSRITRHDDSSELKIVKSRNYRLTSLGETLVTECNLEENTPQNLRQK